MLSNSIVHPTKKGKSKNQIEDSHSFASLEQEEQNQTIRAEQFPVLLCALWV